MSINFDGVILIYIITVGIFAFTSCLKRHSLLPLRERFPRIIAGIYGSMVVGITLCPVELPPQKSVYSLAQLVNMVPFADLVQEEINWLNVFGNIALFIPLIPLWQYGVSKKDWTLKKAIAVSGLLSIMIETLQLAENISGLSGIMGRQVDITDILYNIIGGAIGYIAIAGYRKVCSEKGGQ